MVRVSHLLEYIAKGNIYKDIQNLGRYEEFLQARWKVSMLVKQVAHLLTIFGSGLHAFSLYLMLLRCPNESSHDASHNFRVQHICIWLGSKKGSKSAPH